MDFGDLRKLNFGQTVTDLRKRRSDLLQQKTEIEDQVEVIEQTIEALLFIGNPESKMPLWRKVNQMELQDAVRAVFRRSLPLALLPTEVRDILLSAGFPVSRNLLTSIHTTITRLKDELEEVPQDGRKAYRWKSGGSTPLDSIEEIPNLPSLASALKKK
jgi:hypothetical protein